MTNKELIQKFEVLVGEEKKATRLVLEHIALIEARRAYFDLGYDGMYAYMVKGLGYSEGAAHRRIQASRALKVDTSIGDKLEQGVLNLTQLTQVTQLSRQAKQQPSLDLFQKLENQGKSATEQILAQTFNIKPKEITSTKTQRDESVRLEVTFTKEQFAELQEARNHLSHICPDGDWAQVLSELAKRLNSKFKTKPAKTPPAGLKLKKALNTFEGAMPVVKVATQRRKYIGVNIKRQLLDNAHQHCQFIDRKTGHQCQSQYQLQIDHIQPLSRGGANTPANLQILCGAHNRHKATRWG